MRKREMERLVLGSKEKEEICVAVVGRLEKKIGRWRKIQHGESG